MAVKALSGLQDKAPLVEVAIILTQLLKKLIFSL